LSNAEIEEWYTAGILAMRCASCCRLESLQDTKKLDAEDILEDFLELVLTELGGTGNNRMEGASFDFEDRKWSRVNKTDQIIEKKVVRVEAFAFLRRRGKILMDRTMCCGEAKYVRGPGQDKISSEINNNAKPASSQTPPPKRK